MPRLGSELKRHWGLDPNVVFINHGSFGACPTSILELQSELRKELEAEPYDFVVRRLEDRFVEALTRLGDFLGAKASDLAFVNNATEGVNTVLRSWMAKLEPQDELLVIDHAYNACRNALDFVADHTGAKVVVVDLPYPVRDSAEITERIVAGCSDRTRLAMIDHITSPSALVLPIADIVAALEGRGIAVLVDGAHGPGQVPIDLDALGASYYTGNCHKWLCTPKGAAILHVRKDMQGELRPLSISHGANSKRTDLSRFQLEMGWTGTDDPTAYLCVPAAIDFMAELVGSWDEVRRRNRALVMEARELLERKLGFERTCPDDMVGSMVAFLLPSLSEPVHGFDPLMVELRERGIEVPVNPIPIGRRTLRISSQLYNALPQYDFLATELADALGAQG